MRRLTLVPLALAAVLAGGAVRIVQDQCGPFTDVDPAFCPFVSELYYLGITAGTSATTFSPDDPLTRGQAAVFVAKGLDQSIARATRRAALGQWWTTMLPGNAGLGIVAGVTAFGIPQSDGADVWVPSSNGVSRVRASDGRLLEDWPAQQIPTCVLVAMGRIFVADQGIPALAVIDPAQPPGPGTTVASGLAPQSMAFDGARIWTANFDGSVSIVTPASSPPWPVTTITSGFSQPTGILFDGSNVWVTDQGAGTLLRLDAAGAILQTIPVVPSPGFPVFDGANIWVPGFGGVSVVHATDGVVVATVSGNGLDIASYAAFDGQRILVASSSEVHEVPGVASLFRAADLAPLGAFGIASQLSTSAGPGAICSDGTQFWIVVNTGELVRF